MVLWSWITLCLRTLVAIVFIPYAISKLQNPSNFAVVIRKHRIIPNQFSRIVAWILPIAELVLGLLFLLNISPFIVGIALGTLLVLFSCILLRAQFLPQMNVNNCGCSGTTSQKDTTGIALIRNALLLSSVLVVVIAVGSHNSLILSPPPFVEPVLLTCILVAAFSTPMRFFPFEKRKGEIASVQSKDERTSVVTIKRDRRSFIEWGIQFGIATFIGAGTLLNMASNVSAATVGNCPDGEGCDCGPGGSGGWSGDCEESYNCDGNWGLSVPITRFCVVYCCGSGDACEYWRYIVGYYACPSDGGC